MSRELLACRMHSADASSQRLAAGHEAIELATKSSGHPRECGHTADAGAGNAAAHDLGPEAMCRVRIDEEDSAVAQQRPKGDEDSHVAQCVILELQWGCSVEKSKAHARYICAQDLTPFKQPVMDEERAERVQRETQQQNRARFGGAVDQHGLMRHHHCGICPTADRRGVDSLHEIPIGVVDICGGLHEYPKQDRARTLEP